MRTSEAAGTHAGTPVKGGLTVFMVPLQTKALTDCVITLEFATMLQLAATNGGRLRAGQ